MAIPIIDPVHEIMRLAVGIGASDIHIKSEKPAFLRLSGSLEAVEMDPLEPEHVKEFIE